MRLILVLIAGCVAPSPGVAAAASVPECRVRVLQPVTDDMGHAWPVGQVLPVTIEREGANGGAFCASGGSCLPRQVNGKDAVQLVNCEVGPAMGGGDRRLVPSAKLAGGAAAKAMLSRDEVEQRLSALGFSNASAGGLADDYVQRPGSTNGRLVKQALAGSAAAVATLKRTHP